MKACYIYQEGSVGYDVICRRVYLCMYLVALKRTVLRCVSTRIEAVFIGCLAGVTVRDVAQNVNVCQIHRPSKTFTPHEFVQVAWNHVVGRPIHSLKHSFCSLPIAFHIVCVSSCDGIDEILTG